MGVGSVGGVGVNFHGDSWYRLGSAPPPPTVRHPKRVVKVMACFGVPEILGGLYKDPKGIRALDDLPLTHVFVVFNYFGALDLHGYWESQGDLGLGFSGSWLAG